MDRKKPTWLSENKSNVFSQLGEDGVIGKILELLPNRDCWCVEFGAWDGKYLSNVCNLIRNHSYSAVLIEANRKKFRELEVNYSGYKNVYLRNQFVGFSLNDNLDTILQETPIPFNFDFLSVDIDGNDYHVWKAIRKYKPKSICIEFNHTIPTEIEFVQDADPRKNQGSSLLSLTKLGKEMGYELVSVLSCNAFFVREEFFQLYSLSDNTPQTLRTDLKTITYLFSGFDGHVFLRGFNKLAIHEIELKESKFQPLPRFLQKMRDQYGFHELAIYLIILLLRKPEYFWMKFRERMKERNSRKK
jgi:hypothetical protein